MEKKLNKVNCLLLLACVYCVFTVTQNLFEMKTIGTATFSLMGGGTVVSWIPFMMGDIISEIYGEKCNVKVFTIAGILNAIVVILAQFVIFLPGTYPEQNAAFKQIFSNGVRTAVASFIAFMIGNYINTHIMVTMRDKAKASGKDNGFLFFARAVISTIVGQFFDNFIFLVVAFAPIGLSVFEMPMSNILSITITGTLLESGIESCLVPFITRPVTNKLKKLS
jgi:uncharacterized integral membrane protein (TIGR00697 family)